MNTIHVFDLDGTLFPTDDLNDSYENIESIKLFEGAKDALRVPNVMRILVTAESVAGIQQKKIAVLGIADCFDRIIITPTKEGKRKEFKKLATEFRRNVREILVIGDRIDHEIRYGNECRFRTICVSQGKYASLVPKDDLEIPIHTVANCKELLQVLRS